MIANTDDELAACRERLRTGNVFTYPQDVKIAEWGEGFKTELQLNCNSGPLAMAAIRDGVRYVVRLCTSLAVPDANGKPKEPVFTRRERVTSTGQ